MDARGLWDRSQQAGVAAFVASSPVGLDIVKQVLESSRII